MEQLEGFFRGFRNQELFYQAWKSEESVDKVILITHGMGEHSEAYQVFCEGMLPGPYHVYAWDLRGHGRSEGKRGVASLDEYVADLKAFVRLVRSSEPDKKIVVLGHSMGGLILMSYLLENQEEEFSGVVFSSPLLGLSMEVPALKDMAARLLVKVMPNITLYNEIKHEDLTHDHAIVESYDKDPLRHSQVCPKLYLDFLEAFELVRKKAKDFKLPLLMQLAGDDRLVSKASSEEVFSLLGSEDKTKIVYDRMFHEIYNEVDRQKVFGDLKQWLEQH